MNTQISTPPEWKEQRNAMENYDRIIKILDEKIRANGLDNELKADQTAHTYLLAAMGYLKTTLHIIELGEMLNELGITPAHVAMLKSNPTGMNSYLLQSAFYFRLSRIIWKEPYEKRINMHIDLADQAATSRANKRNYRRVKWTPARKLIEGAADTAKLSTKMISHTDVKYFTKKSETRQRGYIEFEYSPPVEEYSFLDVPAEIRLDGRTYYPRKQTAYGKGILHIFTPAFVVGVVRGYLRNKRLNPEVYFTKLPVAIDQINSGVYLDTDGYYKYKNNGELFRDKYGNSVSYLKSAVIEFMGHDVEINAPRVRIEFAHDLETRFVSRFKNLYLMDVAELNGRKYENLARMDIIKHFFKTARASTVSIGAGILCIGTAGIFGGAVSLFLLPPFLLALYLGLRLDFAGSEMRKDAISSEAAVNMRENSGALIQKKLIEDKAHIEERGRRTQALFDRLKIFQVDQTTALEEINSSMDQYARGVQDITGKLSDLGMHMESNFSEILKLKESRDIQERTIDRQIVRINGLSKELQVNNEEIKVLLREINVDFSNLITRVEENTARINELAQNVSATMEELAAQGEEVTASTSVLGKNSAEQVGLIRDEEEQIASLNAG